MSILRVPLEAAVFEVCMFDVAVGVCVTCDIPPGVGAGDWMKGFGGTCGDAGEKIPSCAVGFGGRNALFCEACVAIEAGEFVEVVEIIGACLGVLAGMGVDFGACCVTTSVGSIEAPGVALLFGGIALDVSGVGIAGAEGGVVALLVMGVGASELPH
jgi:hypothetical protein